MKRIVAADLDRTIIPNGPAEDENSVKHLRHALDSGNLDIIYVTARNISSVERAIEHYNLPVPGAVIGQVGATIHINENGEFKPFDLWHCEIMRNCKRWSREGIEQALIEIEELHIQAEKEQHQFKLSYTIEDYEKMEAIVPRVVQIVQEFAEGDAEVTASRDLNSGVAYVDVMPAVVSKLSALEFYRGEMGFQQEQFLCAGDSENDLSVLLSVYRCVVVQNADYSMKKKVLQCKEGVPATIASGRFGNSGNYGSGIVEALIEHGWVDRENQFPKE